VIDINKSVNQRLKTKYKSDKNIQLSFDQEQKFNIIAVLLMRIFLENPKFSCLETRANSSSNIPSEYTSNLPNLLCYQFLSIHIQLVSQN